MKRVIVRCVVAGALVSGVTGVSVANPEWASDVGVDFWNVPRMNEDLERCRRQSEELEQQTRTAMNRLTAKITIVDEVYTGELTLREAAVRFRKLNAANPKFVEQAHLYRPECSADECQFWNVIDTARNSFTRYPDEKQFVSRLIEELQGLQRRGETRLGD